MKTPPKAQYVGDAVVLDKAEFARLIRQFCGLRVTFFADETTWNEYPVEKCQSRCVGFKIPVAQALEKLNRCDFDALQWLVDQHGPSIWVETAPTHLQLQRRRDHLLRRMPEEDLRLARLLELLTSRPDDRMYATMRESGLRQQLADRAEVEQINARLAQKPAVAA